MKMKNDESCSLPYHIDFMISCKKDDGVTYIPLGIRGEAPVSVGIIEEF